MKQIMGRGEDRGERKEEEEKDRDRENERREKRASLSQNVFPQHGRNISPPRKMNHSYHLSSDFLLYFHSLHSALHCSLCARSRCTLIAKMHGIICKWSFPDAYRADSKSWPQCRTVILYWTWYTSMSNKCRRLSSTQIKIDRDWKESVKRLLSKH